MRADTHEQLTRLVGDDLDGAIEGPAELGATTLPIRSRGVYIIENARGRCVYVGKVASTRDAGRLASRIREHLRQSPAKVTQFNAVFFVPVRVTTSDARIQQLEGQIARHMRPLLGQKWPVP
jgi:excinuclease UvrABC nuclease subunit